MRRINLGINIDHVATLRNARGENDPSLIELALVAEQAGADLITVHLREDRRHIRDADVFELKRNLKIPLNFEMALSTEILNIALELKPATACIVPERREEVTTEGGLDVAKAEGPVRKFVETLHAVGIDVYLFIEPDENTIKLAAKSGARGVEFHTGAYARAFTQMRQRANEIKRMTHAAAIARELRLEVHAGHGLNYHNVGPICAIAEISELNIGHAVIARSLASGLSGAVRDMLTAMADRRFGTSGQQASNLLPEN